MIQVIFLNGESLFWPSTVTTPGLGTVFFYLLVRISTCQLASFSLINLIWAPCLPNTNKEPKQQQQNCVVGMWQSEDGTWGKFKIIPALNFLLLRWGMGSQQSLTFMSYAIYVSSLNIYESHRLTSKRKASLSSPTGPNIIATFKDMPINTWDYCQRASPSQNSLLCLACISERGSERWPSLLAWKYRRQPVMCRQCFGAHERGVQWVNCFQAQSQKGHPGAKGNFLESYISQSYVNLCSTALLQDAWQQLLQQVICLVLV